MFQTGSVLQYAQEAATTEDAPWILLQNGFATCHKINRSAGKIQKGCRSELRLRYTIIPPEGIHRHKPISIARSLHSYIHFPGSSLPVHKQAVRKRLHYLLNTKVCQPCAAGATGLLGQPPTLGQLPDTSNMKVALILRHEDLEIFQILLPPGRWSNQLAAIAQEVGERAARLLPIGF